MRKSLEVEPVQKEEPIIEAVVVEDKVKPESMGDVVAEFLREDPWDAYRDWETFSEEIGRAHV